MTSITFTVSALGGHRMKAGPDLRRRAARLLLGAVLALPLLATATATATAGALPRGTPPTQQSPPAAASATPGGTTSTVLLTQYTYFWRQQDSNIAGSGVAPPTGPVADPTVPSGDVAVAGPQGSDPGGAQGPEKETYLEFDVSAIPTGSRILSFAVTLPVDPAGESVIPAGVNLPIIACQPQSGWAGGANTGQSFSGKPADSCLTTAPAFTPAEGGKSFRAQIAAIAQNWVTPDGLNLGVAVTNDPHNVSTAYQVVFGPAKALQQLAAAVSYLPPAGGAVRSVTLPGTGSTGASSTGSAVTGTAGGGAGVGTPLNGLSAGALGGGLGVASVAVSTPAPVAAGAPLVAGSARSVRAPRRLTLVAASPFPRAGFYLAAMVAGALLVACSLVLGDRSGSAAGPPLRGVRRVLTSSATRPTIDILAR